MGSKKEQSVEPKIEPVPQAGESLGAAEIRATLESLVEPFAESQATAEREQTERARLAADTTQMQTRYVSGLLALVIAVAIIALIRDLPDVAEKVLLGVIGFAGGFGFGRSSRSGGHA